MAAFGLAKRSLRHDRVTTRFRELPEHKQVTFGCKPDDAYLPLGQQRLQSFIPAIDNVELVGKDYLTASTNATRRTDATDLSLIYDYQGHSSGSFRLQHRPRGR